jgi:zinc protease
VTQQATPSSRPRTAAEIGTTETGPRPLPPLGEQRPAPELSSVDTVLANGLRVLAVRQPTVPMVELRLRVPFGGTEATHPARADMLAETLLTGTARRDRVRIDTDLAMIGGDLSASVDPERLVLSGSALAQRLPDLLDVLADVLTGADFPADELARERDRLVERIGLVRSQPGVIARQALQRKRYGDHPVAREVPDPVDVAAVEREHVVALHRAGVAPSGSALILVGDLDPDAAVAAVATALADWRCEQPASTLLALPELTGSDLQLVHRDGAVQGQLRLSTQALPRTDPRYAALQLANLAYGGYFSSRLVENIREDKGYTYDARSMMEFNPAGATMLISTDTASEVTAAALLEIRYELAKLGLVPPAGDELESVRQYAVGSLLISTSSQAGLAAQLAGLVAVGLGPDWLRGHSERLAAVTAEQVAEAALEFFAPNRFTGVVVGDAAVVGSGLAALGGVTLP